MTRIQLHLDKDALSLAPGEAGDIEIALTNAGGVVDSFVVSVEGLPPAIYAITGDRVSLFPGKSESLWLRVQIPAGVAMPAGDYSFQVRAASVDDPTQVATADVAMEVLATGGLSLGLEPQRVAGRRGLFELTISNGGNSPVQAVLDLTDTDEALRYSLGTPVVCTAEWRTKSTGAAPAEPVMGATIARSDGFLQHELEVPPGGSVSIPLLVTPTKRRWTGKEILFSFEARTHPPGVEWEQYQAQAVRGELAYRPILAMWYGMPAALRRALPILLALLFLGVLLFLLFRPTDTPLGPTVDAQATQTALAAQNAVSATLTALAAGGQNGSGNSNDNGTGDNGNGGVSGDGSTGPSPAGIPSIRRFWLEIPTSVEPQTNQGQPNLQYDITAAESVVITPTTRQAILQGWETSSIVDYQLTAVGERGTATDTVSVLLVRPPSIGIFTAEPMTITLGESSNLQWSVVGAKGTSLDGVPIDPGPIGPDGQSKSGGVSVQPPQTQEYIFCASNAAGETCKRVTVWVVLPATAVPPTETPIPTAVPPTPTFTNTPIPTNPPSVPTPTQAPPPPTGTPVPPSPTSPPQPTNTPLPVPPTNTSTSTSTSTSTFTPVPPTFTPTYTFTPAPTDTPTPQPTVCSTWVPQDVPKRLYGRSTVNVTSHGIISDVNILGLQILVDPNRNRRFDIYLEGPASSPTPGVTQYLVGFDCSDLEPMYEIEIDLDDEAEAYADLCDPDRAFGSFKPQNPLSIFKNQDAFGEWTLIVNDPSFMGAPGDDISLYGQPAQLVPSPTRTPRPPPRTPTPTPAPQQPSMLQGWVLEICFTNGTRAYYTLGGR